MKTVLTFVPAIDWIGVDASGGCEITWSLQEIASSLHLIHQLQGLVIQQSGSVGVTAHPSRH